jgi:hypothetical protein
MRGRQAATQRRELAEADSRRRGAGGALRERLRRRMDLVRPEVRDASGAHGRPLAPVG